MLGFEFKKAPPTVYVIEYHDGKVIRAGSGLSFWYFSPIVSIVDVPLSSIDVPFAFHEVTADYQEITLQGQLTYRITNPEHITQLIDFTVKGNGDYTSDPQPQELLAQRLVNAVQVAARAVVQMFTLPQILADSDTVLSQMLLRVKSLDTISMLGIEILALSIVNIKPTPEMSRALEAEAREGLQRKADQAIYARRNAAVEEERRIKESELNTEIAVQTKQRQIRETKMAADIAVEEQRTMLIDTQVENDRKNADSRAYALQASLKPLEGADWRTLLALAAKGGDPRFAMSLAFQEMAENANKIGQLNISPELLQALCSTK
ncbi:MAG TPA: SPFH domain-containing protein [Candidatus Obscuribacterales bacterium]